MMPEVSSPGSRGVFGSEDTLQKQGSSSVMQVCLMGQHQVTPDHLNPLTSTEKHLSELIFFRDVMKEVEIRFVQL